MATEADATNKVSRRAGTDQASGAVANAVSDIKIATGKIQFAGARAEPDGADSRRASAKIIEVSSAMRAAQTMATPTMPWAVPAQARIAK